TITNAPHQRQGDSTNAVSGLTGTAQYARTFTELRQKCPVAWSEDFGGFWSLLKHSDIAMACKKPAIFSSAPQFTVPHLDLGFPWLPLQSDPPDHQNYRGPLQPFLSKGAVAELVPRLRELALNLLEPLRSKDRFDASVEFAQPFAGEALCLALRIPEDTWAEFRQWTSSIVRAFSEGNLELILSVSDSIAEYVKREAALRRENPGDDLMSALLTARVNGRQLNDTELHGYYMLLTSAGHDTSANSLGHALIHLAENPEHRVRLLADPGLTAGAVDEIVRFYGPLIGLGRCATQDVEVGNRTIRAGEQVALVWASAARDEDQFERANEFILDRKPTRNVSFGFGTHYCVGADLGRMQIRVAIDEFLKAFPDFYVDGGITRTLWPTQGIRSIPLAVGATE
ncbi:cytochrome P450, partial [Mycobacterium saskatchewanense]|uniref:cytochrome P450 n=1 Tax=Mycobacterium saskatchewanense TaxID=220927 RepID=UPI001B80CD24